jgi:CheY-like chemotaxis protein
VKPELVITDYAMHEMSGSELIGGVRKMAPDQKVLMVSGTVEEVGLPTDDRKPDDFLPKPYRAADLVAAVKKLAA